MTASQHRSGKSHRDENFPVASMLVEARHRAPILAFYDFVRTADDVADSEILSPEEKLVLLDRLDAGLTGEADDDPEAVRLRTILVERRLTTRHAQDLLKAFRQDVVKRRYATFDELMDYCALSAMPVGRFVLDVHGESRATWAASDATCAALQIINHLQDCAEDYGELDRVYLPLNEVSRHGADLADLAGPLLTPALRQTLDSVLSRAGGLLDAGAPLVTQVSNVRLALEIGVIQRLARRIIGRLSMRDPISDIVHLTKREIITTTSAAVASTLRARWGRVGLPIRTEEENG